MCSICGGPKVRLGGKQKRLSCKPCAAEKGRLYREINKHRLHERKSLYRLNNKHIWKANSLKIQYGLSLEQYRKMLKEQNNTCKSCKKSETSTRAGKVLDLSVDHDHKTGRVRALLCGACNTSLGLLKEDFYKILDLAKYIQNFKDPIAVDVAVIS